MTIDNRHLVAIIALVVGVAMFGGFILLPSEEHRPPGRGSWTNNAVDFEGAVSSNGTLRIDGRLITGGFNERQSRFENVSIRLYSTDGTLLESECLGTLAIGEPIPISFSSDHEPAYVIFASRDFWQKSTVDAFQVEYRYREEGTYYPAAWRIPADLPINIRQHSPCRSDGGFLW